MAQVLSRRRSGGERRQQLKWLLAGAAVMALPQAVLQPVLALPGLSDAVDLDAGQADLAGLVQRALEPAHLSMWTNERG